MVEHRCLIELLHGRVWLIRCYLQYIHASQNRRSAFDCAGSQNLRGRGGCLSGLRSRCGAVHIFGHDGHFWYIPEGFAKIERMLSIADPCHALDIGVITLTLTHSLTRSLAHSLTRSPPPPSPRSHLHHHHHLFGPQCVLLPGKLSTVASVVRWHEPKTSFMYIGVHLLRTEPAIISQCCREWDRPKMACRKSLGRQVIGELIFSENMLSHEL